ncbi:MAG TPA: sulfotransferase [Nonomuraea sp.]|nr:sulfotransferase [Nonomuraea sp.]
MIGAGFGRTGRLSMRSALEWLGRGPCHHRMELVQRLGRCVAGWASPIGVLGACRRGQGRDPD